MSNSHRAEAAAKHTLTYAGPGSEFDDERLPPPPLQYYSPELMPTMPTCSASATRHTRAWSRVKK